LQKTLAPVHFNEELLKPRTLSIYWFYVTPETLRWC